MQWVLDEAKTVRNGGEWGISSQQRFHGPLGYHGAQCSSSWIPACPGPGEVQWGDACSLCPAAPTCCVPTAFWGSLMGQAQSHSPHVGFGSLTLPTPITLGVISNNSHILPPKWSMNNLEKLLWAIILNWQQWVMLLWEAGTQCLVLS